MKIKLFLDGDNRLNELATRGSFPGGQCGSSLPMRLGHDDETLDCLIPCSAVLF